MQDKKCIGAINFNGHQMRLENLSVLIFWDVEQSMYWTKSLDLHPFLGDKHCTKVFLLGVA